MFVFNSWVCDFWFDHLLFRHIEAENVKIEKQFQNDISEQIKHIEEDMSQHIQNTIQFCLAQKNVLGKFFLILYSF